MKILIVTKSRLGAGASVIGLGSDGRCFRLLSPDPLDEGWGTDFQIGEVWEIEGSVPEYLSPPYTEDLEVLGRQRLRSVDSVALTIERFIPAVVGAPEALFDGLVQGHAAGALCVGAREGVPTRSIAYWRPDRPLRRVTTRDRVSYVYSGDDGERRLPFVGFQAAEEQITAGTLVAVSLAPWRMCPDRPNDEPRHYLQLAGWYSGAATSSAPRPRHTTPVRATPARPTADLAQVRAQMARVFGYHEFRPLQEEVIDAVLHGRDTLGVMPTGAGKSLCYQLPALVQSGLTVVVSPLLSLMQDQVDQLHEAGVTAVALNSTLSPVDYRDAVKRLRAGQVRLLYVAPETLVRPETRSLLQECNVACLTVDEAHCISEWGHDFRPEYRRLSEVRAALPQAVCLALTATATARVQNDIRTSLGIPAETTFVAGFDRPNLHLEVTPRTDAVTQVLEIVRARGDQSGIIYCSTRDQVDRMVADLGRNGVRAVPYHAGMKDTDRRDNQRLFQRDEAPIVVATVAFGMGINKSNVRFIIHHSLPDCLETYYQQIGRAGRDGLRSDCVLLFSRADVGTIYHFIETGAAAERLGRMARMQAMLRYAGASVCRRHPLLSYFDDTPPDAPCGMCDNCLADAGGRERVDVSDDARLFLNALLQTRERFGLGQVVNVLRGSRASKVLKWKHDELGAHGTGRQRSEEEWQLLADRFLELGLAEADPTHGTLRVGAAGRRVLDGEAVTVVQSAPRKAAAAQQPGVSDPVLFEALRKLRKQTADAQGVPPYVIFSDRTLSDMASAYPQSKEAFLRVHGVGERKAEVYAEAFLEVIRQHVAEHGMIEPAAVPVAAVVPAAPRGNRYLEVGEAYLRGASIQDLREQWGVAQSTILGHLYNFTRSGRTLPAERILSECTLSAPDRDRALAQFASLGYELLGPVFAALEGTIPYEDLHLLRLYYACRLAGSEDDPPAS